MLDKMSIDFIDYEAPKVKRNQEIEIEYDPRLELVENELNTINEERISEARALVESNFVAHQPKPEVYDRSFKDIIFYRGQDIKEARRYYLRDNPKKYSTNHRNILKKSISNFRNGFYEDITEQDLIDEESQLGSKIFKIDGFLFFNTDEHNWYSHYEYSDSYSTQSVTTHYEIMPNGIVKSCSHKDIPNSFTTGQELINFEKATAIYHKLVTEKYGYKPYSNHRSNIIEFKKSKVKDNIDTYSVKNAA